MATLIRGDGRQVSAYQDAVGFDFGFKGKAGVIKGIGQECKVTVVGDIATIGSGMAVLQGRQIYFDGTDKVALPKFQGTTIYSRIYAELDMAANEETKQGKVTIKHVDSTTSVPGVPLGDDLIKIPTGKANIDLGSATITSGSTQIVETVKIGSKDLIKSDEIESLIASKITDQLEAKQIKGIYSNQILNTFNVYKYMSERKEAVKGTGLFPNWKVDLYYNYINDKGQTETRKATGIYLTAETINGFLKNSILEIGYFFNDPNESKYKILRLFENNTEEIIEGMLSFTSSTSFVSLVPVGATGVKIGSVIKKLYYRLIY